MDGAGGPPALARVPVAMSRLAADYALARFGGRSLSGHEHRRALARWESIRSAIATRHVGGAARDAGDANAAPPGRPPRT